MTTPDRQAAIETACNNAIMAMRDQVAIANDDGRSPKDCVILAAALVQLHLQGITGGELPDCVAYLSRLAMLRMLAP